MSVIGTNRICILDAGPIIHLDEISALELIFKMGSVFIPESVAYEAEIHRPGVREKIVHHIVEDVEGFGSRLSAATGFDELQAGEKAALAWAEKFGADLFVSDDQDARAVAQILNYESIGTIGIIRELYRADILPLDEAIALMEALPIKSSLHVKASFLSKIIASLR